MPEDEPDFDSAQQKEDEEDRLSDEDDEDERLKREEDEADDEDEDIYSDDMGPLMSLSRQAAIPNGSRL